eukprot:TRINITY_DN145_c1_g1_i1.p1 TRINITY_DN145_c1_g1~~TRINITY_DN145_c1_g1_i1.p1  ORF type:complete len:224 (+),score=25.60 TRINITY_DN145_c1_g1_i1:51-722(+)
MAFRTPKGTVIALVLSLCCLLAAMWVDHMLTYESGDVKVDVGLIYYKVTDDGTGNSQSLKWMAKIKCSHMDEDRSDCKTFRNVSIVLLTTSVLSVICQLWSLYHILVGAGTQVKPFFLSFFVLILTFILYLATYDRTRIPVGSEHPLTPVPHTEAPHTPTPSAHLPSDDFGTRSIGELALTSSTDPKLTFAVSFYLLICGVVINMFALFYHLSTCSKRKHEEL